MSSTITLSAGVRQNLLALQNTATLLSSTQNRLATGKKVNSALDNPSNFFTSSALSARASDLSSILDAMGNGINTLQAANNGLTAITNAVQSMQATINQARQDSSFKATSYTIDATTIGTSAQKTISFSGGAVGTTPVTIDLNTADTSAATPSTVVASADYSAPTAATAGTNSFAYAASALAFGAADTSTFDITVDGVGPTTVTLDQATVQAVGNNDSTIDNINELTDAINGALTTAGVAGVTATNDGTNVTFTSATTGVNSVIAISNATPDADGGAAANTLYGLANANGVATGGAAAADRAVTITAGGHTATLTLTSANAGDAATARTYITAQLAAQGVTGVTVGNASGANHVDLTGLADGSNSITLGGADKNSVFGNAAVVTPGAAGSGDGAVKTVDQLVSAINNDTGLAAKVKASNDGGKLNIQNLSTEDLTVTGVGSTSGQVDGSTGTATVSGNTVRKGLITQFNNLRDQLDKMADDSSYNGINLLHGDALKLVFNEINTSSITIQSQDASGINSTVLGIATADSTEFSSNSALDTRSDALHDALTQLRSESSAFGSNLSIVQNRTDFTKAMINTLQTGADNLVLADTNEEAANLLALQTRQQLSTTALSLANQANQAVLRLF